MRRVAPTLALLLGAGAAGADGLPVPRVTIYPREVIRADMLTQAEPGWRAVDEGVARAPADLVGKASRATLLPGRPVPLAMVEAPRVVAAGAGVRLVYRAGGLTVAAAGTALQPGGLGERVRARNADTGALVSGVVEADGTVVVGGP